MTTEATRDRFALVRGGLWLNYLTIGYNLIDAIISVAAGVVSGSVAWERYWRRGDARHGKPRRHRSASGG